MSDFNKYVQSNASLQKLVDFEVSNGDLFLISKTENESSRKKKKINKSDKGIERELIGTEIVFNSIFKKRKINEMYHIIPQQNVLNQNGDNIGRTDLSLVDKKRENLRYSIVEFKEAQSVKKETINSDFNGQIHNYLFEDKGNDYYGNHFATLIYTNLDVLLNNPNKIYSYMNLTEEKRKSLGPKTLQQYGLYIETRIIDSTNNRIRDDLKDYVIPELVSVVKKHHEYGIYNYVKVSDSLNIPTNSPYPEQLKNLRDVIGAAIGSNHLDEADSRNKRALLTEVTNTLIENIIVEVNDSTGDIEVYFNDDELVSIYGRVKEFFCAKKKTIFINHGKSEDSDTEDLSICSCSSALVDGQNSVHSFYLILLLLKIMKEDFEGKLKSDNELLDNSYYKSFRKIFKENDFFPKNESNVQSIKKIELLIKAIENLNIQINIQPLSPYYLNKINEIIQAKNYSIKVSGSDNKLFVYQKEIPLIQEKVLEDDDLQGFVLKYPKSITTSSDVNDCSGLDYNDLENIDNDINEISLNDLIFPHSIIKDIKNGENVIAKLKKVFKGNAYTAKDIGNFFEMIEPYKKTKSFYKKKENLISKCTTEIKVFESLFKNGTLDKSICNENIVKLKSLLEKDIIKLEEKESIVNNSLFKDFKDTLIKFDKSQRFFYDKIDIIKSHIDTNIVDKRLFGIFLAFTIQNNIFGENNVNLEKWAISLNELIKTRNSWTEFVNDYVGSKDVSNYELVMNKLMKDSLNS